MHFHPQNGGGDSICYIPWESQLSGEVSGYPQALMKVVNLQGMLDFRRNFHLSKRFRSRGRIVGGLLGYTCKDMNKAQAETKMARGHRKKRYRLSILKDVSKLSVSSGDFGHNILSPRQLWP